jgi:Haem-NO-binding
MYGMVNKAVEELVCLHHGEDVWQRIKDRANVDVDVFISNEAYPDDITYRLVGAASEILGQPADEFLIAFGEHWVLHTAQKGYGQLMLAGGRTLPEFLSNLPNLHSRVAMIFPKLQPPRFECRDITPHSLRLHYYSHRPGLSAFVVGLMQGLGTMFHTPVTVRLAIPKGDASEPDVFDVTWSTTSAT